MGTLISGEAVRWVPWSRVWWEEAQPGQSLGLSP